MKRFLTLTLVLVCVLTMFVGCHKVEPEGPGVESHSNIQPVNTQANPQEQDSTNQTPDAPETEAPAPSSHTRVTKEEEVAREFIDALLNKDYEKTVSLFECNLDGGADFVFPADVEWGLPRSSYKDLSYFDPETSEYSTFLQDGGNIVDVTVKDGKGEKQTFQVKVKIPNNGGISPMVNGENQFYCRNFSLRTSGGAKLEVEGIEAGPSMIKQRGAGKYGLVTDWLFPVIGMKPKSMRLYCDSFDSTMEIAVVAYNEINPDDNKYRFEPDLTEEEATEALQGVVDLWNNMYSEANTEGANATALAPYIASDAAPDTASTIYDALTSLTKQSPKERNHKLTQISYREGTPAPFWFSNNKVGVNFNYELTWETKYGNSWESGKIMRRMLSIILSREDGEWKVFFVADLPLFNYTNHMTRQW